MSHTVGEIAFTSDRVLMSDDGKPLVCHEHSPNRPAEESAANRAHLCLCWNTHDELLEALKASRLAIATGYFAPEHRPYVEKVLTEIGAAITKAEAE